MSGRVSRRRFWRDAVLVAGVGAQASAQTKTPQEIEVKLANVIRKYGDRLSRDQREKIRKILTENQELLAAVRAFPLENGDSAAGLLLLYPK